MNNDNGMEYVPDFPNNPTEWYEAVITEFIWQTGRTLPHCFANSALLIAAMERGAEPDEACTFLIQQLGIARSSGTEAA